MSDERRIAVFIDFENIALGVKEAKYKKFDFATVMARLLEKGRIIAKRAYADWTRYSEYNAILHDYAVELVEVPKARQAGKNSADIRMVVDALEMCYTNQHLDTFAILSGDSDFSPLVSKLKESDKLVIGVGVKHSTSTLLVSNCDEFIFYEDIVRPPPSSGGTLPPGLSAKEQEAFQAVLEATRALIRESKDILWGSMIKQTIQRKKPSFNEGYYGYDTFSQLLEDMEDKGIISLERDERSGTYVVTSVNVSSTRSRRKVRSSGGRAKTSKKR
jgi:uncharacterized protein (TIGR00288 family)